MSLAQQMRSASTVSNTSLVRELALRAIAAILGPAFRGGTGIVYRPFSDPPIPVWLAMISRPDFDMPVPKLHLAFEIGVILKGLNGLLELISGTLLLLFPPSAIERFIVGLTQNELSKDPHDFIATHLRQAAGSLSANAALFAAIYLLAHGVIKGVLVYGLLRDQFWAFPWAIGVFAAFAVYQIYRYFVEPSGWLILLTVLDMFVILLAWAEWQRVKHERSSERV